MGNLINDIVDFNRSFSMVFDDYHVITNPKIHEALVFFLDNLPQIYIFLSSVEQTHPGRWPVSEHDRI